MKLRKINAVFSLISTILIFGHAISLGICMLTNTKPPDMVGVMAFLLTAVMAIHAVLSIIPVFLAKKDKPEYKVKEYPKMNVPTMVQRISGILMIPFTALHILGATRITNNPDILQAILPPIFFLFVLAHVAVSTSKAFITLGIGNYKFVNIADKVIKLICILTLILDVFGFYIYIS